MLVAAPAPATQPPPALPSGYWLWGAAGQDGDAVGAPTGFACNALPRATGAAGPEAVAEYTAHLQRLLGDVDVVKTLCATSPYKPAFERAFSSAAAA